MKIRRLEMMMRWRPLAALLIVNPPRSCFSSSLTGRRGTGVDREALARLASGPLPVCLTTSLKYCIISYHSMILKPSRPFLYQIEFSELSHQVDVLIHVLSKIMIFFLFNPYLRFHLAVWVMAI